MLNQNFNNLLFLILHFFELLFNFLWLAKKETTG